MALPEPQCVKPNQPQIHQGFKDGGELSADEDTEMSVEEETAQNLNSEGTRKKLQF